MKKRTKKAVKNPVTAIVALGAKVRRLEKFKSKANVVISLLKMDIGRLTSANAELWATRNRKPSVRAANAVIKAQKESLVTAGRTIENLRKGFDLISDRKVKEATRRAQESKGPLISEYEPSEDEVQYGLRVSASSALGYRTYKINGHRITVRTLSQMGYSIPRLEAITANSCKETVITGTVGYS